MLLEVHKTFKVSGSAGLAMWLIKSLDKVIACPTIDLCNFSLFKDIFLQLGEVIIALQVHGRGDFLRNKTSLYLLSIFSDIFFEKKTKLFNVKYNK